MQVETTSIETLYIAPLNLGDCSFSLIVTFLNGSLLAIKTLSIDEWTLTLLVNYKCVAYYWMVLRSGSSTLTDQEQGEPHPRPPPQLFDY